MKSIFVAAALSLVLFCNPLRASLITPEVIASQRDAVLVADIEVEDLQSREDAKFAIKSEARARILKIHSLRDDGGALASENDAITIETLGGEIGDTGVMYSGYPRPYVGRSYRATLRRSTSGSGMYQIAGLSLGLVPLDGTRNYSRNRTNGSNGTGNGPFLYWDPKYFPIPYYLSLSTFQNRTAVADAVDLSFQQWRAPGDVTLEFIAMGCTSTTLNRNDGINAIIIVNSDWEFDNTAIAITRNFYVSGSGARAGLILDTDIMLNDALFDFSTSDVATAPRHDVRNIVTHEVGHFIGMGHEANPMDSDATMYETAGPGEINKRLLNASDLQGLRAAYGGVGQKFTQHSSTQACSLGWQRMSCASTHETGRPLQGSRSPTPALFMISILGILALGRLLFMRRT